MTTYVAGVFLIAGAALALIAAIGLVRFPDLFGRMHAATKPQTLGLLLILIGVALRLDDPGATGMIVVVMVLQLLTAPVASHMVGRAAYRAGFVPGDRLMVDELSDDIAADEGPGSGGDEPVRPDQ